MQARQAAVSGAVLRAGRPLRNISERVRTPQSISHLYTAVFAGEAHAIVVQALEEMWVQCRDPACNKWRRIQSQHHI